MITPLLWTLELPLFFSGWSFILLLGSVLTIFGVDPPSNKRLSGAIFLKLSSLQPEIFSTFWTKTK
uniref:Uncharacterized protein n=1 Tax=Brassica oleracea var. oleracea TaxID=109376 RepID=A0A0D2ZUK8_BRAOL